MIIPDFTLIRLQRELGVEPDGLYGPVTDAALRAEIERLRMALHRIDDKTRDWEVRKIARTALEGKPAEIERLRADGEKWMQIAGQAVADQHAAEVKIVELEAEIERLKAALRAAEFAVKPASYCTEPLRWEERQRIALNIRAALEGK